MYIHPPWSSRLEISTLPTQWNLKGKSAENQVEISVNLLFFVFIVLKPRVEWYTKSMSLNMSPPWKRCTYRWIEWHGTQQFWSSHTKINWLICSPSFVGEWEPLWKEIERVKDLGYQIVNQGMASLSEKMSLSITCRKSTPPQKRQLNISISNSKQSVDDFVVDLTLQK